MKDVLWFGFWFVLAAIIVGPIIVREVRVIRAERRLRRIAARFEVPMGKVRL